MRPVAAPPHPSFLELDRHALGAGGADTAAHVASCETCRGHLRLLEAPAEVPAWAARLDARAPRRFGWPAALRLRTAGLAVAAFACAFVLWTAVGHVRPHITAVDGDPYVGTKGGPQLWLYVKRGDRIEIWNGVDPVRPGDLLRLKVQPDRYPHISVFGRDNAPNAYAKLYDAPVPDDRTAPLPFAWKVDGQPGDETLLIVLGPGAVTADEAASFLAHGDGGRHWVRRLVLAKTVSRDGAPP